MPILILLGIAAVYGVASHFERNTNNRSYNHNNLENMMKEMTGKSKREKRKIVKKYR